MIIDFVNICSTHFDWSAGEIAVLSIINKENSGYFTDYLKQKQVVFSRLEQKAADRARLDGEVISCCKGCSYCCSVYVEATLKECEAIVYHLYRNEQVLFSFLEKYPNWHRKTKQWGDRCVRALSQAREPNQGETARQDLVDSLLFYRLQNIPCPFLDEGSCSIYYSRPFTCASHFVSSPPLWCSPRDLRNPKVYKSSFADEIASLSPESEQLKYAGLTLMPVKVYEIITSQRR